MTRLFFEMFGLKRVRNGFLKNVTQKKNFFQEEQAKPPVSISKKYLFQYIS